MIDWTRLAELREEIGPQHFDEVIELCLEEMEQTLEDLPDRSHASLMQSKLHFLKGSALNIGFSSLATLCQSGETAAKAGNTDNLDMDELHDLYLKSKATFLAGKMEKQAG